MEVSCEYIEKSRVEKTTRGDLPAWGLRVGPTIVQRKKINLLRKC
jgi:hypothetical protein